MSFGCCVSIAFTVASVVTVVVIVIISVSLLPPQTVRRDNCPLVKNVISTCLQKILIDRNVEGAISYTKGVISDLLQNKLDLSLLVITKALSKEGAYNKT